MHNPNNPNQNTPTTDENGVARKLAPPTPHEVTNEEIFPLPEDVVRSVVSPGDALAAEARAKAEAQRIADAAEDSRRAEAKRAAEAREAQAKRDALNLSKKFGK